MRRLFGLFVLALCLSFAFSCGPKKPATLEGQVLGDIPFSVTNLTNHAIWDIDAHTTVSGHFRTATMLMDGIYGRPQPLGVGQSLTLHLMPSTYSLSMGGKDRLHLFYDPTFVVDRPTQLVVYDGAQPAVQQQAGMTLVLRESEQTKSAKQQQAAQTRTQNAKATCERELGNVSPAPGKLKPTGKWKCVLGGAYTGTDYVDLVQLADGKITATVSGSDRNVTWSGVVANDVVHFRFVGDTASGGALKIDASGRAMIGTCHTFTDRGECVTWTLTCTR